MRGARRCGPGTRHAAWCALGKARAQYNKAFKDFEMGYASAIAFFLFCVILILTLIQRKFFGEEMRM